jgi:hypothetical protein
MHVLKRKQLDAVRERLSGALIYGYGRGSPFQTRVGLQHNVRET